MQRTSKTNKNSLFILSTFAQYYQENQYTKLFMTEKSCIAHIKSLKVIV